MGICSILTGASVPLLRLTLPPLEGIMNGVTPLRLQVADEALRILENMQQTKYVHDLFIDEATETYDVDCSGFVSYILGQVAPNHLSLILPTGSEPRLLAHD